MVSVASDPRGWWDYTYQLVTRKALPRLRRRFTSESLRGLGARRREYITLYKRTFTTQKKSSLSDAESQRVLELEETFSVEQALLFRSLAEAEVVHEESKRRARKAAAAQVAAEAQTGWGSWIMGSVFGAPDVRSLHSGRGEMWLSLTYHVRLLRPLDRRPKPCSRQKNATSWLPRSTSMRYCSKRQRTQISCCSRRQWRFVGLL